MCIKQGLNLKVKIRYSKQHTYVSHTTSHTLRWKLICRQCKPALLCFSLMLALRTGAYASHLTARPQQTFLSWSVE